MEFKKMYELIMEDSPQIALATLKANGQKPDVRLMFFYYDLNTKKVYFCTFEESSKVKQFEKNKYVVFITYALKGDTSNIMPYEISFEKVHLHIEHNELSHI